MQRQKRSGMIIVACSDESAQFRSRAKAPSRFPEDPQEYHCVHVHLPSAFPPFSLPPPPLVFPALRWTAPQWAVRGASSPSTCGSHSRLGSVQRPAPARLRAAPIPGSARCRGPPFPPSPPGAAAARVPSPLGFPAPRLQILAGLWETSRLSTKSFSASFLESYS